MGEYKFITNPNQLKVFITQKSDAQDRIDPLYFKAIDNLKFTEESCYPIAKLSEVIDMQRGRFGHRPRNDPKFYGGVYPFIQTGDIVRASDNYGKIEYSQTLNELGLKTSRLFDERLVVITIAANIGDTAILDFPACFPDSLIALKPKDGSRLSIDYINIYFKFLKDYLNDLAPQAAQKNINYQQLSPTPIVIPTIEVQKSIVKIFDEAYDNKQRNEEQAKELLNSIDDYLLNALGIQLSEKENELDSKINIISASDVTGSRLDPTYYLSNLEKFYSGKYPAHKLKAVIKSMDSGNGAGKQDQATPENGVIQIRPTNIANSGNLKYVKNIYVPIGYDKFLTDYGDVLFNNTNSQDMVGKTAIILSNDHYHFSNHITRIKVDKTFLNPLYLKEMFNSFRLHKVFYALCTNWNNQSGVGNDVLLNLKFPVPPLKFQNHIADTILKIRKDASQLKIDGIDILSKARKEVEQIIIGK